MVREWRVAQEWREWREWRDQWRDQWREWREWRDQGDASRKCRGIQSINIQSDHWSAE
jgi:hypothetical protein